MQDVIQSMITLTLEQGKMYDRQHAQAIEEMNRQHAHAMEELREMREMHKEHRIDIMALFQVNKELRESMAKFFGQPKPDPTT